jgi:hypothetical protein
MQRIRQLLVASLLIAGPASALADAPADIKKMNTDDCAKARAAGKTCVISIEGIDVEGITGKGQGERIGVLGFDKHESLIRLRRDFIPEILKTAEDL